ncbi:MAG: hypothetical protein QNJ98_04980 [Planctomycetota bacterium]|nr:hypothetical protein [Planctomycetota bacterium]
MTVAMDEVIERFKTLHEHDLKILRLEQELRRGPAQLQEHETGIKAVDAKIKAIEDRMRLVRAQRKILENELRSKEDKIGKLKEQANEVRSNKEFMAFRSEIANTQDEANRLQNEILKFLEIDEQAASKVGELNEEKQRKVDQREAAQARVDERLAEVKQQRDDLVSSRGDFTGGLPDEGLADYERTRRKLGKGAAILEGSYCGACGDMLTKNEVYSVQNRTKLVFCRSCRSLLYLP